MLNLQYERRTAAKNAVEHLENLVAILTQRSGPEMLFVYHHNAAPAVTREHITAITLRELPNADLERFDGLLIGFSVLDALRGDLITKGPDFFPIERFYLERGERDGLYHVMGNLSVELMRRLREASEQMTPAQAAAIEAKALQIALPGMLHERDCANLVAVLPVGELNRFISRKTCHYLYYNAETGKLVMDDPLLNTGQNWVIALEETALLCTNIQTDAARFLDLRVVLRGMQRDDALQTTRKNLARLFFRHAAQNEAYRQAAWSLAVEYWLAQIECEDLVAFCPHNDFEQFLENGDSVRVYRTLENNGNSHPLVTFPIINQSLRDLRLRPLPEGYGDVVFAFPGIQHLLRTRWDQACFDLGKVLYKAGYEKILARSLWLFSHDLLRGALSINIKPAETHKAILDPCSRACLIYNLSDPWEWRQGRWQLYLEGAYQTRQQMLRQALLEQITSEKGDTLEDYYHALSLWYGCAFSENLEHDLEATLEKLQSFQREARGNPYGTDSYAAELAQSAELRAVVECLLNRMRDVSAAPAEEGEPGSPPPRENIPSILRQAADLAQPLPLISPLCRAAAEQLRAARRKRQYLYTQERNIQRIMEQLEKLQDDLENQKRQFFIPIHEKKALDFAFEHEIRAVAALIHELETSAKLNVVLKNTWVDIHQPVHLTLEITNKGRVEANTLEVVLDQPRGFTLLDPSPVREIPALYPNTPNRIDYYIRPERVGAELRVEYSFSDPSGQRHKDAWTTYLNVRSLDTQPFQIKVNRYQFGRPIQNMTEFYGRRSELQNILSLLQAGGRQNLLLRGPRRMGKTSLLYMLKVAITNHAARRFFGIPPEWDEQLDKVHPVFLSLHSFNLMSGGDAASQFFRTLLERIGETLEISAETRERMVKTFEQREDEVGVVNAALEQTTALLSQHPNQRFAVLLDEYDEVYQPGTGSLDRHLREFVSAEQRMTWVIASTLALFHEVKTISSPWFNVFMIIELSRLSEEAAIELVEEPTRDENIFWRSDAVLSLLTETGRHPAFTQLFCGRVIAYLNQAKTNYVLQETILSIADQIVDEQETANNHFEFYWQDTPGTGQLILLILDDQDQPLKREDLRNRVRRILGERFGDLPHQTVDDDDGDPIEWLEREFKTEIDWVEKITNSVSIDNQKRYFFTVPLFRRWLRRRRQYQDLREETLDKIAREMENDGIQSDA